MSLHHVAGRLLKGVAVATLVAGCAAATPPSRSARPMPSDASTAMPASTVPQFGGEPSWQVADLPLDDPGGGNRSWRRQPRRDARSRRDVALVLQLALMRTPLRLDLARRTGVGAPRRG